MSVTAGPGGYLLEPGDGEAVWFADSLVTYKTTGDQTSGGLALAEVTARQGSGSPWHRHHHEDEAWYILEGELTFWLGDARQTAGAGTFVFGPREVAHRFVVDSEVARFLLLVTPAGFEGFTRSCGWPAARRTVPPSDLPPRDAPVLAQAARTHGLDVLDVPPTAPTSPSAPTVPPATIQGDRP